MKTRMILRDSREVEKVVRYLDERTFRIRHEKAARLKIYYLMASKEVRIMPL